jgi:hypothetical protein
MRSSYDYLMCHVRKLDYNTSIYVINVLSMHIILFSHRRHLADIKEFKFF